MFILEKQKGILLGSMLSEISQKEKDKYSMLSLIYEIFKKPNSEKQRVAVTRGWRGMGRY